MKSSEIIDRVESLLYVATARQLGPDEVEVLIICALWLAGEVQKLEHKLQEAQDGRQADVVE